MSYFTVNWYKTKNGKNTKLRVLVIDFTQHGGSENNRVGSEKSRFIFSAAGTFYCCSSPLLSASNSLSTTSSAFSSSFSSSQTASSSEPSTALAIPQDLHLRVFFGGKTNRLCFDLFIHNEHLLKPFFKVIRNWSILCNAFTVF